jgi:exopolysaccharide production protein ExoQ
MQLKKQASISPTPRNKAAKAPQTLKTTKATEAPNVERTKEAKEATETTQTPQTNDVPLRTILLVGFFALAFLEVQGVGIVQWRLRRSGVIFDGYRLGLKMIFGVGSAVIVGHHLKRVTGQLRAIWALAGLGLWYLASSLWSVAPAMTIELALYFLMAVVLCVAMRVSLSATNRARALCLSFTLSAFISFFFRWHYGDFVTDPGWDGGFPAIGGLGANSAIAVLLLLWGCLSHQVPFVRVLFLFGLGSNIALLFLSRSDSSILTTIFGIFGGASVWLYATLQTRRAFSRSKSALFTSILVSGSTLVLFLLARPILATSLDSFRSGNTTASGRTTIWAAAWDLAKQRPVLGFGFNTFWNGPAGINEYVRASGKGVVSMHNAYVESIADGGFIALGLLIAVLVCFGLSILRGQNHVAKAAGVALLVTTSTMGMLDSYLGHVEAAHIMVLGILTGVPGKRNGQLLKRYFDARTVALTAVCALFPALVLFGAPKGDGPIIGAPPKLSGNWPSGGTSVERSLRTFRRLLRTDPTLAGQRNLGESGRLVEALQWQMSTQPIVTLPLETDLRYARKYLGIIADLPTDLIGVLALNAQSHGVPLDPRMSDLMGQLAATVIQRQDLQQRYLQNGRFRTTEFMALLAASSDPGLCGFREIAVRQGLQLERGVC